jgi:hypothetical protein
LEIDNFYSPYSFTLNKTTGAQGVQQGMKTLLLLFFNDSG